MIPDFTVDPNDAIHRAIIEMLCHVAENRENETANIAKIAKYGAEQCFLTESEIRAIIRHAAGQGIVRLTPLIGEREDGTTFAAPVLRVSPGRGVDGGVV